jgi:hypothetical protein
MLRLWPGTLLQEHRAVADLIAPLPARLVTRDRRDYVLFGRSFIAAADNLVMARTGGQLRQARTDRKCRHRLADNAGEITLRGAPHRSRQWHNRPRALRTGVDRQRQQQTEADQRGRQALFQPCCHRTTLPLSPYWRDRDRYFEPRPRSMSPRFRWYSRTG